MVCYAIHRILGRKGLVPVFMISFGLLLHEHYIRYMYRQSVYKVEIDMLLMMGTLKIIAFAFTYSDGGLSEREVEDYVRGITANKGRQRKVKMNMMENRIIDLPSFFEYMSFMNCFYTCICGPYLDYN